MRVLSLATLVLLIFWLSGCISRKKVVNWQDLPLEQGQANPADSGTDYAAEIHIQPFDVLDIQIGSSKQGFDKLFQSPIQSGIPAGSNVVSPNYYSGYLVDGAGNVNLPVIGTVPVKNLTLRQAKSVILEKAQGYLTEPFVEVKFLTYKVHVMGSVRIPGQITIANEKATVIDAISLAGDLNEYGNSKRIKVVRGTGSNPKGYLIDLTSIKSMQNQGFYLQPNDIVYVEPLPRRFFVANLGTIVSAIGIANVTLLLLNFLRP